MMMRNFLILIFLLAFFIFAQSPALAQTVDWKAIEKKPSKLYDIKVLKAAFEEDAGRVIKIVNNNQDLLQQESFKNYVINKVDILAQQNISILNDNPYVKRAWFLHYGIKDGGGTLQRYDGKSVTLSFFDTTFKIAEHKGAIVTYRDSLILPNEAEIFGGLVKKDGERVIIVDGTIDITNSKSIDILAISETRISVIRDNKRKFTLMFNTEPLRATIVKDKDYLTISGKEVIISDKIIIGGEEKYRFNSELSGGITITKKGILLAKDTLYTTYFLGLKNVRYKVGAETLIFNKSGDCEDIKKSCIEADTDQGILKVKANDNNKIIIETFSFSYCNSLYVEPIADESEVIFIDKGSVKMTFGRKPFIIEGYLHKISVDVFYLYDYAGKQHEIQITDGFLKYCSICKTKGAISTVDLTKFQTQEIKLFDKAHVWAANAIEDPRYTSLGGAKGKIVYADRHKIYEKNKTHDLRSYKQLILAQRKNELNDKFESKKLAEERIKKLEEQLVQETDNLKKEQIIQDIKTNQEYIAHLNEKIVQLEETIDQINKIEYAYDCIGFVQAAFIEGERALQKSPYNWYKETDGFKLIQELTLRYKVEKVLVVFGSPFNETHYIHGKTKKVAPIPLEILATRTKILYFETKRERDDFLRTIPPGSPFQNYNLAGTPHHSGIKGISESSLEAHIGDIGWLAEDDIQRYNDPLVFAFPEKKRLTLDDLLIAKK